MTSHIRRRAAPAAATLLTLGFLFGCGGARHGGPASSPLHADDVFAPGPLPRTSHAGVRVLGGPAAAPGGPEETATPYQRLGAGDPLTLADCTAIALARNHDLAASGHGENLARLAHRTARALLRPTLTHGSGLTHQFTDVPTFPGPFGAPVEIGDETRYEANTTLAYVVFDFGRSLNQARSAGADWDAARIATELARENVRFLAAQAFYGVKEAQARVRVLERESLPALERSLRDTAALQEAGRAVKSDTMLLDVARERTAQDLRKANDAVRSAVWRLNQVMGVLIDNGTRLADAPGAPPPGEADERLPSAQACVRIALRRHPALRRNRAERRALERAEKSARAAQWPRLSVAANHQFTSADNPFQEEHTVTGAVSLHWPLYQGGARRARRAAVAEQMHAKDTERRGTAAEIERSVREARMRVDQIQGDRRVAAKAVRQAEQELANITARLRAGRGATRRDELDARVRLETRRLVREQLVFARHVALAALRLAVGDELQAANVPPFEKHSPAPSGNAP